MADFIVNSMSRASSIADNNQNQSFSQNTQHNEDETDGDAHPPKEVAEDNIKINQEVQLSVQVDEDDTDNIIIYDSHGFIKAKNNFPFTAEDNLQESEVINFIVGTSELVVDVKSPDFPETQMMYWTLNHDPKPIHIDIDQETGTYNLSHFELKQDQPPQSLEQNPEVSGLSIDIERANNQLEMGSGLDYAPKYESSYYKNSDTGLNEVVSGAQLKSFLARNFRGSG